MPKALGEHKINPQQKQFCDYYLSKDFLGNGVMAYAEAYNKDLTDIKQYNVSKVEASKFLTKPNILSYLETKLEEIGFNDVHIDKQLLFIIRQNADFGSKLGAIREYNKLKSRIQDKMQVIQNNVQVNNINFNIVDGHQHDVNQRPEEEHRVDQEDKDQQGRYEIE